VKQWFTGLVLATLLIPPSGMWAQTENRRAQAYELLQQGDFTGAAAQFERYLESSPDDLPAGLDYVDLLTQLQRHDQAVAWLERLHRRYPDQEPAYFRLGTAYLQVKRFSDAERVFTALRKSPNPAMASAAAEASKRLQAEQEQAEKSQAEARLFQLAKQGKHEAVLAEVESMEKRWPLPYPVTLQRLYALYNLQRFEQALPLANTLAQTHPRAVDLALLRAELLVQLKRPEDASAIWREIEANQPGAPVAAEARRRRLACQPPPPPPPPPPAPPSASLEEDKIYALAQQEKDREVVEAAEALEKKTRLSWPMELQRLYALYNLHEFHQALNRAEALSKMNPDDVPLAFLRAELLVRADRVDEAVALWRQIEQGHPDTAEAREAAHRRQANEKPPPPAPYQPTEEDRIFGLAQAGRQTEVIAAVDALERRTGQLSWPMELQRLYALQAVGDRPRAQQRADQLAVTHGDDPYLTLIRADLLSQTGHPKEAGTLLYKLQEQHTGDPVESEARRRLRSLPPIARVDKWYWGEAYFSGDYFGRFDAVTGSGVARHGYFMPGARWLQPYAEFRFGVDTESGIQKERTVVTDNHLGFYGGLRAQVLPTEYLFLYAQGGFDRDLLDRREDGDWAYDYQAGIYGFKSWGPGIVLKESDPAATQAGTPSPAGVRAGRYDVFWRGDWFLDGGADFSYYHRYASWIGYGQAREGFRLFQIGPHLALDTYLVENLSWDAKGNYFDNLVELGPGARWIWKPCPAADIILRAEWLNGFYLGRDELDNRGDTSSHYDEVRVGLTVGLRW
jgi:tetratricopeptide (TPR) repeat protein